MKYRAVNNDEIGYNNGIETIFPKIINTIPTIPTIPTIENPASVIQSPVNVQSVANGMVDINKLVSTQPIVVVNTPVSTTSTSNIATTQAVSTTPSSNTPVPTTTDYTMYYIGGGIALAIIAFIIIKKKD